MNAKAFIDYLRSKGLSDEIIAFSIGLNMVEIRNIDKGVVRVSLQKKLEDYSRRIGISVNDNGTAVLSYYLSSN